MKRREFITLVGGAAAWPGVARAQQPKRIRRIGLLLPNTSEIASNNPRIKAFLQELGALGWLDGQNVVIEQRFAQGQLERLSELATELARINVDVIVTAAAPAAKAAKEATSTIPVIILDPGDPVGTGLVRSLARPGGNVTGVTSIAPDLAAKRLALLKETVPALTDVAVFYNAAIPPAEIAMTELQAAAKILDVGLISMAARKCGSASSKRLLSLK